MGSDLIANVICRPLWSLYITTPIIRQHWTRKLPLFGIFGVIWRHSDYSTGHKLALLRLERGRSSCTLDTNVQVSIFNVWPHSLQNKWHAREGPSHVVFSHKALGSILAQIRFVCHCHSTNHDARQNDLTFKQPLLTFEKKVDPTSFHWAMYVLPCIVDWEVEDSILWHCIKDFLLQQVLWLDPMDLLLNLSQPFQQD